MDIPEITSANVVSVVPATISSKPASGHTLTSTGFTRKSGARTEETGRLGERLVYEYLLKQKASGEILSVSWVSENAKKEKINPQGSAALGYDMEFLGKDEIRYYVEVKSSEGDLSQGIKFNISDFECNFAKEHEGAYFIYYVSGVRSKEPQVSILNSFLLDGEINTDQYAVEAKTSYTIFANIVGDGSKSLKHDS